MLITYLLTDAFFAILNTALALMFIYGRQKYTVANVLTLHTDRNAYNESEVFAFAFIHIH
jgi:hypothetical protein